MLSPYCRHIYQALSKSAFRKLVHVSRYINFTSDLFEARHDQGEISIRGSIHDYATLDTCALYSFPFVQVFISLGFPWQSFNEAASSASKVMSTIQTKIVLFFLRYGFIPLGFPSKVLMRQLIIDSRISKKESFVIRYSLKHTEFSLQCFTQDILSSIRGHPRGSVINNVFNVAVHKQITGSICNILLVQILTYVKQGNL